MKKFLLSAFVVLSFVAYALQKGSNSVITTPVTTQQISQSVPTPAPIQQTAPPPPVQATPTPLPAPAPTPTPAPSPTPPKQGMGMGMVQTGRYKNGTYSGNVVDAFYGNVQVKAIITNGKLSDVQFLDYPHDRSTSREINAQATPMLRSEAISAQSGNVDIISGATATSQAFIQSLQSALAQATNNV